MAALLPDLDCLFHLLHHLSPPDSCQYFLFLPYSFGIWVGDGSSFNAQFWMLVSSRPTLARQRRAPFRPSRVLLLPVVSSLLLFLALCSSSSISPPQAFLLPSLWWLPLPQGCYWLGQRLEDSWCCGEAGQGFPIETLSQI